MRRRFAIALTFCSCLMALATIWANSAHTYSFPAQHVSSFRWQIAEGWFGGFSALEIDSKGNRILAVSDRGQFVRADLVRDNGEISDVKNVLRARVIRKDGRFPARAGMRDSEGISFLPDGAIAVVFEGDHRLERFSEIGAKPTSMPWSKTFDAMALNGGFEALAIDHSGVLYALPEKALGREDVIQVFALNGKTWRKAFDLKRDKQFQPVGADFGPDGRLYLLERGFNGLGFRTRVRSFGVSNGQIEDEKLLFRKGIGIHDNLEGLSVWRDDKGQIRLTMISDDNFRLIQRTEIVEYVLTQ